MKECPCGKYNIREAEVVCPYCGLLLKKSPVKGKTTVLDDPDTEDSHTNLGTARISARMTLVLRERETGKEIRFDMGGLTEITLGRVDPDTGRRPDVDLAPLGAHDRGVSRRHAAILRIEETSLKVVDRGSGNGTYLNGTKMVANQPWVLRDKDELRLGYLVLEVRFEKPR